MKITSLKECKMPKSKLGVNVYEIKDYEIYLYYSIQHLYNLAFYRSNCEIRELNKETNRYELIEHFWSEKAIDVKNALKQKYGHLEAI